MAPGTEDRDDVEMRRRARVAGLLLLVVHSLYTLFQVASLVWAWHPPFIVPGVLWGSVAVNATLDVAAVGYLAALRVLGPRPGSGPVIRLMTVAFAMAVQGVWIVQMHIGGSQSSHMLAVVLSTMLVYVWVLPGWGVSWVVGFTVVGVLGVVALETADLLTYSPLLPGVQGLRDVFLDWRVLLMNAAILGCTMAVALGTMTAMNRSMREGREALSRSNDHLRREVAERERVQESLQRAAAELSRANGDLRRLIQGAAHDLRSPMTVIDGYASLLREETEGPDAAPLRSHVEHLERGTRHMRRLLDDLSRLVLVDDRAVRLVPCDAARVVEGVVALLDLQVREAGARVEVGRLPVVLAEEVRLARVFQNLLGNALKFRGAEPPRIRIEAEAAGDDWSFQVEDNGIGIPPDQAERVFEPFVRLGGADEGSGIGLSVCRKAIESMGGTIRVDPRPGGGSRFHFTLHRA